MQIIKFQVLSFFFSFFFSFVSVDIYFLPIYICNCFAYAKFQLLPWLFSKINPWRALSLPKGKWVGGRSRSNGSKTRRTAKLPSANAATDCSRKPTSCLFFAMLRLPLLSSLPAAAFTTMPTTGTESTDLNFFLFNFCVI